MCLLVKELMGWPDVLPLRPRPDPCPVAPPPAAFGPQSVPSRKSPVSILTFWSKATQRQCWNQAVIVPVCWEPK